MSGCQNLVFPVAEVLFTFLPKHWPALLPSLAPGDEHELEFAQAEVGRDRPTEERLQASQAELNRLRQVDHPNLFTFSDGSAKEGTRYGVGGVFIQWLDGSETSSAAPASANDSSKATETAAVANALDLIERRLEGQDGFHSSPSGSNSTPAAGSCASRGPGPSSWTRTPWPPPPPPTTAFSPPATPSASYDARATQATPAMKERMTSTRRPRRWTRQASPSPP